jgi:hypothetical protein
VNVSVVSSRSGDFGCSALSFEAVSSATTANSTTLARPSCSSSLPRPAGMAFVFVGVEVLAVGCYGSAQQGDQDEKPPGWSEFGRWQSEVQRRREALLHETAAFVGNNCLFSERLVRDWICPGSVQVAALPLQALITKAYILII